ncbi:toxin-antitoxin system HicB family antitoxin [Amycolatopsis sp. WQ 127309]|uniref:FitA-like ribbon-helix-helix domain-containing protein n=1 Tax=Amycolatopsis sp. WQ 127309 TaxID=2932773 RepID=UPI001FF5DEB9|nr:toxin-antitoxin system HicB family antitoxin [Amycolatopsis sp. WQ 127309]UOZ07642.1 toxin-antitoxin system HicB family antitoxin [Amycolatopsis sp. WQ 127309]
MKQLITRIDDELHARLKARAEAEGRSMNDLVTEALRVVVAQGESPLERRDRLIAEGKLLAFEPEGEAPGHDKLEELSRGWGPIRWNRGER